MAYQPILEKALIMIGSVLLHAGRKDRALNVQQKCSARLACAENLCINGIQSPHIMQQPVEDHTVKLHL